MDNGMDGFRHCFSQRAAREVGGSSRPVKKGSYVGQWKEGVGGPGRGEDRFAVTQDSARKRVSSEEIEGGFPEERLLLEVVVGTSCVRVGAKWDSEGEPSEVS